MSTPQAATTGYRIGDKIRIAEVVSMRQPTTRSKRFISSIMIIQLSVTPSSPCATACGTCSMVSTRPRTVPVPTMIRMVAEVFADSASLI